MLQVMYLKARSQSTSQQLKLNVISRAGIIINVHPTRPTHPPVAAWLKFHQETGPGGEIESQSWERPQSISIMPSGKLKKFVSDKAPGSLRRGYQIGDRSRTVGVEMLR